MWEFGAVAPGYLSNAIPGDAGSPTCLNSDGCTTQLIYYDCLTSGADLAVMGEGVATRLAVFAYHLTVLNVLPCFHTTGVGLAGGLRVPTSYLRTDLGT